MGTVADSLVLQRHRLTRSDVTRMLATGILKEDDRIAIMLAPPGLQLIGGAIHLGKAPLAGAPPSMTGSTSSSTLSAR